MLRQMALAIVIVGGSTVVPSASAGTSEGEVSEFNAATLQSVAQLDDDFATIMQTAGLPRELWWAFGREGAYQEAEAPPGSDGVNVYFPDSELDFRGTGVSASVSVEVWMNCNGSNCTSLAIDDVLAVLKWDDSQLSLSDVGVNPTDQCHGENDWDVVAPPSGCQLRNGDCNGQAPFDCGTDVRVELSQTGDPLENWDTTGCQLVILDMLFATDDLCAGTCQFDVTLSLDPGNPPFGFCDSYVFDDAGNDVTGTIDDDVTLHHPEQLSVLSRQRVVHSCLRHLSMRCEGGLF